MKIKIEKNNNDSTCLVWLNDAPVTFRNEEEAHAYVEQLKARLEAAPVLVPEARD
ncbi:MULTISPECIES: hypothetical protein [Pseudomonas]|uniref:Uncharacterized protein n=1 Tax=Pseudomonas eucalypticola TaxID=2599595 RepID=A0A7D5D735_9PSED|nr:MULTISPECIES: hypothetical protein [Pseudomonas]QKZ04373.1 hypothetical protein HWQ56_11470 [Pseudomonas eucalypticola]